jgi:RNA polymerase-binding transcription factor DksA
MVSRKTLERLMTDYSDLAAKLRARLAELTERSDEIGDDLRGPLDADYAEQAVDLADDEALEGVDEVLRAEARQIGFALTRIDNGTYGSCTNCGERIALARLEAEPAATRCIKCAD